MTTVPPLAPRLLPRASLSRTVIVLVLEPSATRDVGLAVTVLVAVDAEPTVNATSAVCVTVTESVESVAVYVTVSATASLTLKVACPAASVVPETVLIVELPDPAASVTALPASGCPKASRIVAVSVDVVLSSAVSEAGAAARLEPDAEAGPAWKSTDAVCVIVVESVESVAVYVTVSTLESLTVKVATPLAFVDMLPGAIVEKPPPCPSETVFPATRLPCASFSVTVIVAVVEPSASTEPGLVASVDVDALTAPGTNWTSAVWATVSESVVSVAVYVTVSATASLTVNVAWPLASVVPDTVAIVELPEPAASVTVLPASGWLNASRIVAVIVEVVLPSAVIEAGEAERLEPLADAGPAVKSTSAVCDTPTESVVSVAV